MVFNILQLWFVLLGSVFFGWFSAWAAWGLPAWVEKTTRAVQGEASHFWEVVKVWRWQAPWRCKRIVFLAINAWICVGGDRHTLEVSKFPFYISQVISISFITCWACWFWIFILLVAQVELLTLALSWWTLEVGTLKLAGSELLHVLHIMMVEDKQTWRKQTSF